MRYDKPVYFVKIKNRHYDPDAGIWEESGTERQRRWANITEMGVERQQTLFGNVKLDRKVVRVYTPYQGEYDHIEINGENYFLELMIPGKHPVLVVSKNG